MGAHLAIATVPACKLTARRSGQLKRLIAKLPRSDLEELIEVRCLQDDDEEDEVVREEARELLRRCLDDYDGCIEYRDVTGLQLEGMNYGVYLSGGLSWGDSPTETFDTFLALSLVAPLSDKLREWAIEDARPRKKRVRSRR
jgi:hypothetical protein